MPSMLAVGVASSKTRRLENWRLVHVQKGDGHGRVGVFACLEYRAIAAGGVRGRGR